jgi:hypothetical protein
MVMVHHEKNTEITEGMIRHMTLNTVRLVGNQFKKKYGEIVIACDNKKSYWRRDFFPFYKAHRKELRDKQTLVDWNLVHTSIANIVAELHDYFPFRVINVEGAEADDIIASLSIRYSNDMRHPIMIISRDHDFHQLLGSLNVEQYDWMARKPITVSNAEQTLREHIIRGDAGDGIPNILSDDNCFVLKIRQAPITQKRLDMYLAADVKTLPQNIARNFDRNKHLIDFAYIPEHIHNAIHESFDRQEDKNRKRLFDYFIKYKLKELMKDINDF